MGAAFDPGLDWCATCEDRRIVRQVWGDFDGGRVGALIMGDQCARCGRTCPSWPPAAANCGRKKCVMIEGIPCEVCGAHGRMLSGGIAGIPAHCAECRSKEPRVLPEASYRMNALIREAKPPPLWQRFRLSFRRFGYWLYYWPLFSMAECARFLASRS